MALAIALDKTVRENKLDGFRNRDVKERKIKKALSILLNSDDEAERVYAIAAEQGEY